MKRPEQLGDDIGGGSTVSSSSSAAGMAQDSGCADPDDSGHRKGECVHRSERAVDGVVDQVAAVGREAGEASAGVEQDKALVGAPTRTDFTTLIAFREISMEKRDIMRGSATSG
jgi:hypothetical protein